MVCSRCGKNNDALSRYCSACGLSLADPAKQDPSDVIPPPTSPVMRSVPKQYSPEDIEELLSVRKMMKKEEPSAKVLKQDDVDKLFG